jgi:hypothetical protein
MAIRTITITDRKLPEGLYRFRVMEFNQEIDHKKGNDVIKLKLATVSLDDGKTRVAWDWFPITEERIWKFQAFLISTGHAVTDGKIEFDDETLVGMEGFFLCSESEVEKDGKSRTYTNYRYLRPDDEQLLDLWDVEMGVEEKPVTIMDKLKAHQEAEKANGQNGTEDNPRPGCTRIGGRAQVTRESSST